jgi:hypothetical protein
MILYIDDIKRITIDEPNRSSIIYVKVVEPVTYLWSLVISDHISISGP